MIVSWFRILTFSLILTAFLPVLSGGPFAVSLAMADEAEDFRLKGNEAYEAGIYEEALRWYRMAAGRGNVDAQYQLGYMYTFGKGVPKDAPEAIHWYRMAAEQGNAAAKINLGVMYQNGLGIPKDDAEAVRWYRMASGAPLAQYNLARMYENGWGVPKDEAEAARWYRKAAEWGYADAQRALGVMYRNGYGILKDDAEAAHWYRKAAEQGDARAQTYLGNMYVNGMGVIKNEAEAVRWYSKAAEQGSALGQNALAWRLATSANSSIKNSPEAVQWAEQAVQSEDIGYYRDTLAAAYAAAGRFSDAVREQKKAISQAKAEGNYKSDYEDRLRLYQSGKALFCPGGPGCE